MLTPWPIFFIIHFHHPNHYNTKRQSKQFLCRNLFIGVNAERVGATIGRPFIGRPHRASASGVRIGRFRTCHARPYGQFFTPFVWASLSLVGATIGRPFAARHSSVVFGRAMHAPTNIHLLHGVHDKRKSTLVGATIGRPHRASVYRLFADVQCTPLRR